MTESAADDGSAAEGADWDKAWQRWQLEAIGDDDSSGTGQSLEALARAEIRAAAAREEVDTIAKERAYLQEELVKLQRLKLEQRFKQRLPYEYEEIEELYRILEADKTLVARVAMRGTLVLVFAWLLVHWRAQGFEGVAGCLLMPIVCAGNDLLDFTDQLS